MIEEQISEPQLKAYHVGFDQGKFRIAPLVDVIRGVIPEFSLGFHAGKAIPINDVIDRIKEAAETVYLTDNYQRRGEFGELILHFLLRDFHDTIPLISKIYFKDSHNVPAHGFDCVHVSTTGGKNQIWLGESKLYAAGEAGVKDLAGDITKHVNGEFIKKEFSLISKRLPEDIPEIEAWRTLMHRHQKLDVIFDSIVIPMVCTYSSPLFLTHSEETVAYLADFENECQRLNHVFKQKSPAIQSEVKLFLLPVPCKDELNTEIDKRLKAIQRI